MLLPDTFYAKWTMYVRVMIDKQICLFFLVIYQNGYILELHCVISMGLRYNLDMA